MLREVLLLVIFALIMIFHCRIATMVKNQSTDPMCKTNLIIAPMALLSRPFLIICILSMRELIFLRLDQWKMEIEVKTNNGFKCLIYHGNTKPRRKQDILKYDVRILSPSRRDASSLTRICIISRSCSPPTMSVSCRLSYRAF